VIKRMMMKVLMVQITGNLVEFPDIKFDTTTNLAAVSLFRNINMAAETS